jgi:hypothetical protein
MVRELSLRMRLPVAARRTPVIPGGVQNRNWISKTVESGAYRFICHERPLL